MYCYCFIAINRDTTELAKMVDYEIAYVANEQLKFFMVADRFMHNAGEIDWYDRLYQELDERLAQVLVDVEKESDEFALEYAKKHHDDDLHYFIAVSGGLKGVLGKEVSRELENKMEKRTSYMAGRGERSFVSVVEDMPEEIVYEAVCPILSEGDIIGAVILLESDNKRKMNDGDMKLIQAAAGFLGKQMEH